MHVVPIDRTRVDCHLVGPRNLTKQFTRALSHVSAQNRKTILGHPNQMILAVPYSVTAALRVLHDRSIASRSPKGEGFTDPIWAGFKKNVLKPHRKRQWVIPPDANAGFVAAMEDVLETYQKPRDPDRPLVCVDETSKQLIVETRKPIPAKPGRVARHDYEYERNGVANIFMMFAPLEGWRHVKVTDHHAAVDYAQVLKELSDLHFPNAKQIVLVQDNLSTHTAASLYAAFPADEARRLVKRFEWRYTPKHGSWLDMAESELGVLSSQCLSRRIPNKQILEREVAAWRDHRNKHHAKADWQFTTDDARVGLKRLYPSFSMTRATSRSVDRTQGEAAA